MSRGPRIVDFSTHMSGPLASGLLAEAGAEVIKVESPTVGDGNRGTEPRVNGLGVFHLALNRGVRSLAVSTRSEAWPGVVEACARWADAVIVGARPSDARRRGLDFASLRRINPAIVYCLISGFGETGPWSRHPAHGQTLDAFAGNVPVDWVDGSPRTPPGWRSAGPGLAGVFAALGVMTGLYKARDGVAQHVSVSLWKSAIWWNWRDTTTLANLGHPWTDYGDLGSRYAMYATADDRAILVAPVERKFWVRFVDLLGLPPEYRDHCRWDLSGMEFGRDPEYAHEPEAIAAAMRTRTLDEWVEALGEIDIPFAPMLTLSEVIESEHAASNPVMREVTIDGEQVRVPVSPMRVTEEAVPDALDDLRPPPAIGEHTEELLAELGIPDLAGRLR
jgi:crotonobetainyl-CoA:carnitine CoA-transferase CaiB-like acyl-CoA transferase